MQAAVRVQRRRPAAAGSFRPTAERDGVPAAKLAAHHPGEATLCSRGEAARKRYWGSQARKPTWGAVGQAGG